MRDYLVDFLLVYCTIAILSIEVEGMYLYKLVPINSSAKLCWILHNFVKFNYP